MMLTKYPYATEKRMSTKPLMFGLGGSVLSALSLITGSILGMNTTWVATSILLQAVAIGSLTITVRELMHYQNIEISKQEKANFLADNKDFVKQVRKKTKNFLSIDLSNDEAEELVYYGELRKHIESIYPVGDYLMKLIYNTEEDLNKKTKVFFEIYSATTKKNEYPPTEELTRIEPIA